MIRNVLIGSDPEFFISDGNRFVPSINIIPGDKVEPYSLGNGYYIQKDNVLIEGNIPPARSREEFVSNMREIKALMNDYLSMVHPSLHIVSADSAEFNMDELQMYPEAMEFGCHPYRNAWTQALTKAQSLGHLPVRTAGFHIHFGYEMETNYNKMEINRLIVKAFDYFVTKPSRNIWEDKIRSYYYGELGSYRDQPWGVEARSLGGYFTKNEYLPKIYDASMQAIEFVNELIITNRTELLERAMSINEIQYDNSLVFAF
jgi:hypothetical protein